MGSSARHAVVGAVVAAVCAGFATSAAAWTTRVGPGYFVFAGVVAAAPDGGVFLDAGWKPRKFARGIALEKRGPDGTRRWRRQLGGLGRTGDDGIADLVAMPDGDVIGAGGWANPGARLLVLRLRGRDGRQRWRTELPSPAPAAANQRANALAITRGGDVVVAGSFDAVSGPAPRDETFVVLALRADDGRERWRYTLRPTVPPALNVAWWTAVDAAGDVLAGGAITVRHDERSPVAVPIGAGVVVKLDGDTGVERWRTDDLALDWTPEAFALTSQGDVVVGGDEANDFQVALVDGVSGVVRWTHREAGPGPWARATAVLGLPDGDVAAAGMLRDPEGIGHFAVMRLAGDTGGPRWRRELPGDDGEGGGGYARALALGASGDLIVGGDTSRPGSCTDLTITELAVADGALRRTRRIDGTSRATSCVPPDCERPPCGDPRAGIDADHLWGLEVGGARVVIAGEVCDGPRGRARALVGSLRLRPAP